MSFDKKKDYLGDGAYVELSPDPQAIIITTSDGIKTTNTISLDAASITHLFRYLNSVWGSNITINGKTP